MLLSVRLSYKMIGEYSHHRGEGLRPISSKCREVTVDNARFKSSAVILDILKKTPWLTRPNQGILIA